MHEPQPQLEIYPIRTCHDHQTPETYFDEERSHPCNAWHFQGSFFAK